MVKFLIPLAGAIGVALPLFPALVRAGDGGEPRREFRQSSSYPYTFVPVSYLQTGGPKDMRFGPRLGECSYRDAPLLPAATPTPTPATKTTTETTEKVETTVAASSPAPVHPPPVGDSPAYPPPAHAPAAGSPDLNRMPEEIMSYFRNPYNAGPHGPHLFDPIFEPGYHEGPKSKATYQLSDKP